MEETAQEIVEESDSEEMEQPVKEPQQNNDDLGIGLPEINLKLPKMDLGIDF